MENNKMIKTRKRTLLDERAFKVIKVISILVLAISSAGALSHNYTKMNTFFAVYSLFCMLVCASKNDMKSKRNAMTALLITDAVYVGIICFILGRMFGRMMGGIL